MRIPALVSTFRRPPPGCADPRSCYQVTLVAAEPVELTEHRFMEKNIGCKKMRQAKRTHRGIRAGMVVLSQWCWFLLEGRGLIQKIRPGPRISVEHGRQTVVPARQFPPPRALAALMLSSACPFRRAINRVETGCVGPVARSVTAAVPCHYPHPVVALIPARFPKHRCPPGNERSVHPSYDEL
jgi:hypothetical protein